MGNSSENPKRCKIVYGAMFAKEKENKIDMPPKSANTISPEAIELYGDITINTENNTIIKDDNGKVVARVDNKYPRVLVAKNQNEKECNQAVIAYMKEKGIKSISELVENSEEHKAKKAATSKRASGDRGDR